MTGKPLVRNLKYYLDQYIASTTPVVTFDRNVKKTFPCIVVGYNDETPSFSGNNHGHYTVGGYVTIEHRGYADADNELADADSQKVINLLLSTTGLLSTVNSPLSGVDHRPLSAFHLNGLIVRGVDREIDENSMIVNVKFDAFCVPIDR